MDVFQDWNIEKEQMGYSNKTRSEFAEILLQNCEERSVMGATQTAWTDERRPTEATDAGMFTVCKYYIRIINCLHQKTAINII